MTADCTRGVVGVEVVRACDSLAAGVIVNADIVLMADTVTAGKRAAELKNRFVLLSRRWDYDMTAPLDFSNGWESRLRKTVEAQGGLHRPAGSDFFLFPKSCYQEIPDFTIGRAGWDNWMIYKARKEKWPVIDCTPLHDDKIADLGRTETRNWREEGLGR